MGDLLDPASVESALRGADKLFLMNAVVADELPQALIAITKARKAGIKHIVYLSALCADKYFEVPHLASKRAVENALRELEVGYWSNFAKRANPNGPELPEWPQYQLSSDMLMNFTLQRPKAEPDPRKQQLDFTQRAAERNRSR